MIAQSTIDEVKAAAKIADVIRDFIDIKHNGSQLVASCPYHSESTPSFKIHVKENFAKCFGCGKSVDSVQFVMDQRKIDYPEAIQYLANKYKIIVETENNNTPKKYTKPVWKNNLTLPDKVVKWFETERKISQTTLEKMKITSEKTWMPEGKFNGKSLQPGEREAICFNYFRDGELINIKYRDSMKTMRLEKGAELIWYNIDSLRGAKKALIVEGEIDDLACIEAGLDKIEGLAILSVPNGANIKSNNLAYLDSSIELFDGLEIILGTDCDTAGRKLRDDLADRFGKERCKFVEWKDKKDANDVLKNYGRQAVLECYNEAKNFPIIGVYNISDYSNDIDDMFVNGIERGAGIGMENFDKHLRFVCGWITGITGVPSAGKSDWLDQMILKLMIKHKWKAAFYSPENDPFQLHFSKLARKLIGKGWYGKERINEREKNMCKEFLEDKLWIIKPKEDFSLDNILASVSRLKQEKGISCFVIDAWNRLEHKYKGGNETQYVQESLMKLDTFCRNRNVHCFLVAHPTKLEPIKGTNRYPIPTLYNISGGAHFRNILANGLAVHRDIDKGITKIVIQKVKFIPYWGDFGTVEMTYDVISGRFNESAADGSAVIYDNTNWITGENRQVKANIPEQPAPSAIIAGTYDIGDEPPF